MPRTPTYLVYYVKKGQTSDQKKRDVWTKVGAAWEHKDKKGLDIIFDLMPHDLLHNPRLVLRVRQENVIE